MQKRHLTARGAEAAERKKKLTTEDTEIQGESARDLCGP